MNNDNARNGLRGNRPSLSASLLGIIQSKYGFNSIQNERDLGGSSNLNIYFETDNRRLVARVYRPSVTVQRLHAIQSTRAALAAAGIPCAVPYQTTFGEKFVRCQENLVEVEAFVPSEWTMDTPERIELAMPWLARMHEVLAQIPPDVHADAPLFSNHIESAAILPSFDRAEMRLRTWALTREEADLRSALRNLAETVAFDEQPLLGALKYQRAHGDFWDNNVFFNGTEVILIADFDYMGRTPRTDDLARTIYFALTATLGTRIPLDGLLEYACALVDAYDSRAQPPLTADERRILPFSIARQPLWWFGGWLVDLDSNELARRGFNDLHREIQIPQEIINRSAVWQKALAG